MITINLVCVGNLKEKFWQEASSEYQKRLSKFCKLNVIELQEQNKYDDIEKIKQVEGDDICTKLVGKCYLLDIGGKQYASEELANEIQLSSLENSTLTFIIGGSYGVSEKVRGAVKNKLSFGKATYPHNLARIILLEQIYRAFMINSGGKYHK